LLDHSQKAHVVPGCVDTVQIIAANESVPIVGVLLPLHVGHEISECSLRNVFFTFSLVQAYCVRAVVELRRAKRGAIETKNESSERPKLVE
jgi:hypothetical protein